MPVYAQRKMTDCGPVGEGVGQHMDDPGSVSGRPVCPAPRAPRRVDVPSG